MNRRWIASLYLFALLVCFGMMAGPLGDSNAQEEPAGVEKGVDVLAHGPIHEAFAETVAYDPEPGIIVPKAPPEPINEIPPKEKPEGDPEWIPGYWAWDDDQNDFIWVSGIWREVPPDRQWIPGYWTKSGNGYQWISGYWAVETQTVTEYLPEPPESVEVGPNVPAPSANYSWIPGCWIWSYGRYAWQPGYWAVMRPDWVWVPAHYVWTPGGYIFVGGYWDYAVGYRGVLFAPVAFSAGVSFGPGFYFTPSFMINLSVFSDCLFLRPRYHHYYFGDYYAHRYYQRGIFPWFSPHARRHGYDPIYAHQRWKHRHDPKWGKRLHATYEERVKHEEARPPRTLRDSRNFQRKNISSKAPGRSFKQPFMPVTNNRAEIAQFKPLSKNEREHYELLGKKVRNLSNERSRWESQATGRPTEEASGRVKARRVEHPRSPIAARPSGPGSPKTVVPDRSKATHAGSRIESGQKKSYNIPGSSRSTSSAAAKRRRPPARYKSPQVDTTVQPLQRRRSENPQTSMGNPQRSPSVSAPGRMESSGRHSPPQSEPRVESPQNRSSEGRGSSAGAGSHGRGHNR